MKLDHYLRMTDETGILQSAVLALPDYRQGYTTADNARALIFSLLLEQAGEGPFIPIEMQAARHLAFLLSAFNPEHGRFRGAMSYQRAWLDEEGSEETHGLALWALGTALGRSRHPAMQGVAHQLFDAALPAVRQLSGLCAWGFSLLGIDEYLRRFPGDRMVARAGQLLLDRILDLYQMNASEQWPWFENTLTSNSACVSQALIAASNWTGSTRAAEIGLKTLGWLASQQFTESGQFVPFGDAGYLQREQPAAHFAQRPIEARSMISACLEAYRRTADTRWLTFARSAFQWFLGQNDFGESLYNADTGACSDGLLQDGPDPNCGAEALLAFLVSQLEMRLFDQLYHSRITASAQLPILQIGSPNPLIKHE
jgi:hypothetical protein